MRGIASISARLSKSFMPKTLERSFKSRSRSPESLVQSVITSSPRFGVHARHCLGKPTVMPCRLFLVRASVECAVLCYDEKVGNRGGSRPMQRGGTHGYSASH